MSKESTRGKPKKVEEIKDVQGAVTTLASMLIAHVRKSGAPLGEEELTLLLGKLWIELEEARTPADDLKVHRERQGVMLDRVLTDADGDLSKVKNRLFIKVKPPKPKVADDADKDLTWDPFTRIVASSFLQLLDDGSGRRLEVGCLSRRIVPGVLNSIRLLVGDELIEQCRVRSKETLNRLQDTALDLDTEKFWKKLYQDAEALDVRAAVYARLAMRFVKYKRRKWWFIRVLNGELALSQEQAVTDADYEWHFDEGHFVKLMLSLFASPKDPHVFNPRIASLLEREYGDEGRDAVGVILEKVHEDMERQRVEGVREEA